MRRLQVGGGAHHDILRIALQRSGKHVECGIVERLRQVADGQPAAGERALVDVDAEDLLLVAILLDVGNAVDGGEAIDHLVFDELRQVVHVELGGGDGKSQDRRGIRIRLDDLRRVRFVGQVLGDAADRVAHVVGGDREIDRIREFQSDPALAEGRGRRNRLQAADARDRPLDHLGQLLVDRLRRSAVEGGAHGDDGTVNIRQFAHLDADIGGKVSDDHQRVEHQRQDQ